MHSKSLVHIAFINFFLKVGMKIMIQHCIICSFPHNDNNNDLILVFAAKKWKKLIRCLCFGLTLFLVWEG